MVQQDIIYFPKYPCLDQVVKAFQAFKDNALVREGIGKLADKFASPDHLVPNMVADFEEVIAEKTRAFLKGDAHFFTLSTYFSIC